MRLKKTSFFSQSLIKGSDKSSHKRSTMGSEKNLRSGSPKSSIIKAFLFFIALSALSSPSFGSTIICRNNKAVRTLRTDKANEGGCRAVYTKEGVDQVVGSSTREAGCGTILSTIRKTLEAHSWKCKETKSGAVSNLSQ